MYIVNTSTNKPYNQDFAAMAHSAGISGVSADRSSDLAEAVRAGGTSIRELPGMGRSKPAIGKQ